MKRLVALLLSACALLAGADARYPEHGRVIETRVGRVSELVDTFTDPLGRVHRGHSVSKATQIYRVETDTRIYEFTEVSKKAVYAFGDQVEFRVNRDRAFFKYKKKERVLDVTSAKDKAAKN